MNDFAPPLKKLLRAQGWELLRHGKGDHDIWHHPKNGRKLTIDHKIKSRHTANAVLKQAGLAKAF
ncbi:MAG: type II toxin-antitoxin system HicA family toxin [Methylobacterium mesophilicum]|nr:type II toxin-antitoxin system HicA family toxin [Methylobacterium mesophilicum]